LKTTISVPENMRADFEAFLADEKIELAVTGGAEGTAKIIAGESQHECSVSELYADGWIKCQVARDAADLLNIKYRDIGKILDRLDIKIRECGLGCF
jgi:hypothetical protein